MKLRTHYVFSTGLLTLVDTLFINFYYSLVLSAYGAVIANTLIDKLGHREVLTRRGYVPARTPLTHTLYRSIAWGLISIIPFLLLLLLLTKTRYYYIIPLAIDGIIVGPSHMLLDAFTERGVYVKRKGKWVRFALAHYKYDNPTVNSLAILAGFLLLLIAYYIAHFYYYS